MCELFPALAQEIHVILQFFANLERLRGGTYDIWIFFPFSGRSDSVLADLGVEDRVRRLRRDQGELRLHRQL